jgi:glycosyltransferase involved in cell wall biosynthesis
MNISVSVIIPVFNSAKFLRKAVESACSLTYVAEVLLIEDGSTDDSYSICKSLADENKKVRVYAHEGRRNKGAGASRDLGLERACCDFISFLDSDDYYLPGRFDYTFQLLEEQHADGIFEAVGTHYYDQEAERLHLNRLERSGNPRENKGNTMLRISPGDNVFRSLVLGRKGWIHLDGLTIKKSLLSSTGGFNHNLETGQDTEFILRCAFYGRLVPGNPDRTVAKRGVHGHNRIISGDERMLFERRQKLNQIVFDRFRNEILDKAVGRALLLRYVESFNYYYRLKGQLRKVVKGIVLIACVIRYPSVLRFLF